MRYRLSCGAGAGPGPGLLDAYRKAELDWPGYERRYLAELQPADIAAQLAGILLDRACLLCAEEGADHCHRRLAAEWLNQADPHCIFAICARRGRLAAASRLRIGPTNVGWSADLIP